ncbi:hypothetical protein Tco_1273527 [Tanacetum coccineum]
MQLSSSTPSQPQALKIGETSRKSAIKRREEQIQAELQQAHTQITKPPVKAYWIQPQISLLAYRIAELEVVFNDMVTPSQEA